MEKTFTVAGTSNLNGVIKFRFANDLKGRIKVLERNGHTDVQLFELPEAMTKDDAKLWLQSRNQQPEQNSIHEEILTEAEQIDETQSMDISLEAESMNEFEADSMDEFEADSMDEFEDGGLNEFANEDVEDYA